MRRYVIVKRALDLVLCLGLLALVLPVGALCALAIKIESRGPVFFRCRRVGFRGRELRMLKFRKMRDGASGAPLTVDGDARFTRVGRLLARTKLDEIPQLWNVLRGEMSLVGPRPEDPAFVDPRPVEYSPILAVKPGMTGLTQLAFAKEGEIVDVEDRVGDYVARLLPQKMALDTLYAGTPSVRMDLRILVWTAFAVVLRGDVAVNRHSGRLSVRRWPARERSVTVAASALKGET